MLISRLKAIHYITIRKDIKQIKGIIILFRMIKVTLRNEDASNIVYVNLKAFKRVIFV